MMTTIAIPRPIPSHQGASIIGSNITPPHSLEDIETPPSSQQCTAAVPNKHLPSCPTGPAEPAEPDTPPSSPNTTQERPQVSLLYPADDFIRVDADHLSIYEINASYIAKALTFASRQPLPKSSLVFPWLHGLHPQNHIQQAFFNGSKRALWKVPSCLRGITLVKADGDLSIARLKGAVAPSEFMQGGLTGEFIEADPIDGFSVRNFHIQPAKMALTSDIIVYDDNMDKARRLAWEITAAQLKRRKRLMAQGADPPEYNTFLCTSSFKEFEDSHKHIVAINAEGISSGMVLDFIHQERKDMWDMTAASEISQNVFMGPTPEPGSKDEDSYDVLIECSDLGRLNPLSLRLTAESSENIRSFHDFPSSGSILPPTWSHTEADGILETCKWIYHLSHETGPAPNIAADSDPDSDGNSQILLNKPPSKLSRTGPRKILIHCADGYTESTMLGIAYFSYSTGLSIPDAWLKLHTSKGRNFFAYPTDVSLLNAIAPRLLRDSPASTLRTSDEITRLIGHAPRWMSGLDGSFPSRILHYLYLGNLGHANNPDLLRELGILQILSVGESATWREGDLKTWGHDNVCLVEGVQDNGVDPLMNEISRCLEFIDRGRRRGIATLVHCRVGVSRSATVCIAEVMQAFKMSFSRAYCFVRARRLNVIIQPHLRFVYELLQWEETLQTRKDWQSTINRELEWAEVTREIALMNQPYSR